MPRKLRNPNLVVVHEVEEALVQGQSLTQSVPPAEHRHTHSKTSTFVCGSTRHLSQQDTTVNARRLTRAAPQRMMLHETRMQKESSC